MPKAPRSLICQLHIELRQSTFLVVRFAFAVSERSVELARFVGGYNAFELTTLTDVR